MTPIIPFRDGVWLKMDYFMPTLSFKDRGAAVLIAHAKSIGVKRVIQDSSGNAGNSVAAYCGRAGIACDIFVPEGTSDKKIRMIEAHGATAHIIPGNRDHCADVCRTTAREEHLYYANHVYNPFFMKEPRHISTKHTSSCIVSPNIFLFQWAMVPCSWALSKGWNIYCKAESLRRCHNFTLFRVSAVSRCSRPWNNMLCKSIRRSPLLPWQKALRLDCLCAALRSYPMRIVMVSKAWPSPRKKSFLRAACWPDREFTVNTRRLPFTRGMKRIAGRMAQFRMC